MQDNRRVALIKSLATNNRFYALVSPESGIKNADTVEFIPENTHLGIAYPCLEDGLNDFAVIRTTFETLDLFPEDDPIREEMMEIIRDARGNLLRRLTELHDKIASHFAHFLGSDYDEFKNYAQDIVHRGYPRRNLDSMMKLNVFSSVAQAEGYTESNELLYHFQFDYYKEDEMSKLESHPYIVTLFAEVIQSVTDDGNYKNKYLFDKNVFQKFIAVMFVNYATTDPIFYGINKRDYGVSAERDMDNTPLYLAIRRELVEVEQRYGTEMGIPPVPEPTFGEFSTINFPPIGQNTFDHEKAVLGPLTSMCAAAAHIARTGDAEMQRFARGILADASRVLDELKQAGVVSPSAADPGTS